MTMNFRFLSFCATLFCSLNLLNSLSSSSFNNAKREHVFKITRDGSTPRLTLHRDIEINEQSGINHHSIPVPETEVYETTSIARSEVAPWTENDVSNSGKFGGILLYRKTRAPGDRSKHLWKAAPQGNGLAMNMRRGFENRKNPAIHYRYFSLPDPTTNEIRNVAIMVPPSIRSEVTAYTKNRTSVARTRSGPLLSRRARETTPEDVKERLEKATLEIYEGDAEKNAISLRLSPLDPGRSEIDEYGVSIVDGNTQVQRQVYKVSEGLACTLWENSVCLKDFLLPTNIALADVDGTKEYEIKVDGLKGGGIQHPWRDLSQLTFYKKPSSAPPDLTIINQDHGIVTVKWGHPRMPNRKIKEFNIGVTFSETRLADDKIEMIPKKPGVYLVEQAQKEYTMDLELRTSTNYFISVKAGRNGTKIQRNIWVPSGVAFANGEKLQVEEDGTFIKLTPPKVVNATHDTIISVTVLDGRSECTIATHILNVTVAWVAAEYKINDYEQESSIVVGGHITSHPLLSYCALQPGETYKVKIKVKDVDPLGGVNSDTLTSDPVTITFPTSGSKGKRNLGWIVVFPIVGACGVLIGMCYNRRRKMRRQSSQPMKLCETNYVEPIKPRLTTSSEINSTPQNQSYLEILPSSSPTSITPIKFSTLTDSYAIANQTDSRSVSIGYFEEYAKEAANSGVLHSQFMMLRGGLTDSCEYGSLPENMLKNRDVNQIAYDNTRVVLKKIPGDPHSDYINASYIKGYKKERAYIATQGPMPNTINDFWRMIWQAEVRVICMLTNVTEGTKEKCEKYWPDVEADENYGNFRVSNKGHEVFADYTFRTFKLSYKQDSREITHLHYTGWPSLGVPMYPQSLVAYLKKLRATPAGNGPVVVHCHTGDGRTGTVILCDICIRRATVEKVIDVVAVTKGMRDSRANMVSTVQEYLLGHIVITESMMSLPTRIPCDADLSKRIKKMRIQLRPDIQRLEDTMWQEQSLKDFAAPERPPTKNVADGEPLVMIRESPEKSDLDLPEMNRVNAVSVDGIKMKKEYLACSLPSPFTLSDFWAFVTERNIQLMIILQCSDPRNPTCSDILPDESIVVPVPDIQVKNIQNPNDEKYFTREKLLLTNPNSKNAMAQSVTVLTCKGWGRGENGEPPPTSTLVSLWIASEKIPRQEGRTLVLCHDGVTGCGLYLALSFLLERMALERECDVISAVRAVRRSKPEFVRKLEQYEYLYDAAETYAEYFECYANFT